MAQRTPITELLRSVDKFATPAYHTEAHDLILQRLEELEESVDKRKKENKPLADQLEAAKEKLKAAKAARAKAEKQAEKLGKALEAAKGNPLKEGAEKHPEQYDNLLEVLNKTVHTDDEVIRKAFQQQPRPYEHKENCSQCFRRAYDAARTVLYNFQYRSDAGIRSAKNMIEATTPKQTEVNTPPPAFEIDYDKLADKVVERLEKKGADSGE